MIPPYHFQINAHKGEGTRRIWVKPGDVNYLEGEDRKSAHILDNLQAVARRGIPSWLELDQDNFIGTVKERPNREEITMPIQEHLIVELYSK